jgi:hypothetical protein
MQVTCTLESLPGSFCDGVLMASKLLRSLLWSFEMHETPRSVNYTVTECSERRLLRADGPDPPIHTHARESLEDGLRRPAKGFA